MHQRSLVAGPTRAVTRARANADENRAFVRELVARKQPALAYALAFVERQLERQARQRPVGRLECRLCDRKCSGIGDVADSA